MNPEISQTTSNPQLEGDDLRAALGFSTNLLSQMRPQDEMMPTESLQDGKTPQGEEVEPETEKTPIDVETLKKELKNEIMEDVKKEIGGIRDAIQEALNEQT